MTQFTFIDLFAGIGGFHQAMASLGGRCVFASEWDKHAATTYYLNYGLEPQGDITQIDAKDIPSHDVLCAGFPCQAFSIAGKQKGFEDTRGTLFFEIARIVEFHRPQVLFLENVKNLVRHNNGHTIEVIYNTLKNLDYTVYSQVLNTSHYGLPQNRERIYIVAIRKDLEQLPSFSFPPPPHTPVCLVDILEDNPIDAKVIERPDIYFTLPDIYQSSLFDLHPRMNKPIQIGFVNKGGQGERIYSPWGHAITLSAYGGGVGAKTGLYLIDGKVRKLSPRECARLQGFPENFIITSSLTQAYKQFGNSVSVNVLKALGKNIIPILK